MDLEEIYEAPSGTMDSSERSEKKEQLRAKVQALVSCYEEEKRRNEELTMELDRIKSEQQAQQSLTGNLPPMNAQPAAPAAPGGISFSQRPQQQQPNAPAPFPGADGGFSQQPPQQQQQPQQPSGSPYTLQSFGAQPSQQGGQPPQSPFGQQPQQPFGQQQPPYGQQPQSPYGQPQSPYSQPPQSPYGQPQQPPYGQAPQQSPYGQPQSPYGQPQPSPYGGAQGAFGAPSPMQQGYGSDALMGSINTVLQTITQVRSKLHQFESIRGQGYPQQPSYMDYDTVALLDQLYDQLGDLSRELMQRQGRNY